ncbi:hypothetical protein SPAN111604_04250 [Sphingomonas antarctica]|uniref:formyltransferase family protein n=1 Tax=Sphingomonas antarctica TaxID=2040274 RepID=UPI0039E7990F
MTRLSVLGYASGSPLSHSVMRRIAADHDLIAIVTPARGLRAWLKRVLRFRVWGDVAGPMAAEGMAACLSPDLIVVASYPKILPLAALQRARVGALNVHMSVLPRHRGIDPVFSTYWHDDADAGVTVHWMDAGVDSGDIAAQVVIPLVRGRASRDLYFELAERAAALVADLLSRVAEGDVPRRAQGGSDATTITAADIVLARVPFATWPAERVWHVLSGLGDQHDALIADSDGAPALRGRAIGWKHSDVCQPGRIDHVTVGYDLHCSDGIVTIERES